jgi:hypothetical protein
MSVLLISSLHPKRTLSQGPTFPLQGTEGESSTGSASRKLDSSWRRRQRRFQRWTSPGRGTTHLSSASTKECA